MSTTHHLHHITHHRLLELFTYGAICAVVFVVLSLIFGWIRLPTVDFVDALPVSYSNDSFVPLKVNNSEVYSELRPTMPDFDRRMTPLLPQKIELLP